MRRQSDSAAAFTAGRIRFGGMNAPCTRRRFVKTLLTAAGGVGLLPLPAPAANKEAFSFLLLGDLHYDKVQHHDLNWLHRDKPDDLRQIQTYDALTRDIQPRLFATVRETIADLNRSPETAVAFTAQLGDFVEGLCGSERLARQQNSDALEFVRDARLATPFLFTKGNHDITGAGAPAMFDDLFLPFLTEQSARFNGAGKLTSARYTVEYGNALFCFFDAFDRESLPWLEAVLARRVARHCFVLLHPPVVPYGARATWNLFAGERHRAERERLLQLLGINNAFVLCGHIHKFNLLVRATAGGGRFLQLGLSSVITAPEVQPEHLLSGVASYNPDQVNVEPNFSPGNEKERRAVYVTEAPFIKRFEYADLPGYAVVTIAGPRVTARIYSTVTRQVWRILELNELLET